MKSKHIGSDFDDFLREEDLLEDAEEFAAEMRLAAAIHWFSQGLISQGKGAEIAGLSRAEFLEELFRRKVPAIQVTLDDLREELARDSPGGVEDRR